MPVHEYDGYKFLPFDYGWSKEKKVKYAAMKRRKANRKKGKKR